MDRIVITAFRVTSYLNRAFTDGCTPFEYTRRQIDSLMTIPGFGRAPLLVSAGLNDIESEILESLVIPAEWDRCDIPSSMASDIFDHLNTVLADTENILVVRLDAPFVDTDLALRLTELHRTSWCDYTFGDGYPVGYAVELLRRDVVPVMRNLAESAGLDWTPGVLFRTLQRDINAFDIETEASPEDYTLFRASMTVDTRQNYTLCMRLVESTAAAHGAQAPVAETDYTTHIKPDLLLRTLLNRPQLRRTLPYYFQVQVTTETVQRPVYQPWAKIHTAGTHMSTGTWQTILEKIVEETPECTVALGHGGEPACHPAIGEILSRVAAFPEVSLYIETSGIGWSESTRKALLSDNVRAVIIELDAYRSETYQLLRNGTEQQLREASDFAEWLARNMPGRVYVQATRMTDNEWELQEFYRHWNEQEGISVIIQKYNSFAGTLKDRKVADLTPLSRIPCRHLERDMVVLVDGSVSRCFQDIYRKHLHGSLLEQSFHEVWESGTKVFLDHLQEDYPAMCLKCDEYYTFNA